MLMKCLDCNYKFDEPEHVKGRRYMAAGQMVHEQDEEICPRCKSPCIEEYSEDDS